MRKIWILAGMMALLAAADAKPADPDATARNQAVTLERFDAALLGREIFRESNVARKQNHLPTFLPDRGLSAAADVQATMMSLRLNMEHGNLVHGQSDAMERAQSQGVVAALVLENVAMTVVHQPDGDEKLAPTYAQLAARIVQQWMDSPGHRANLLSTEVTLLGCAARGGLLPINHEAVFSSQVFARPRPLP